MIASARPVRYKKNKKKTAEVPYEFAFVVAVKYYADRLAALLA